MLFVKIVQKGAFILFSLYKHIEELGKTHGYDNINQLCAAAGVSRSVMSELNSGRNKIISMVTAQKFADCLGVSLDVIYGWAQETISNDDLKFALFDGDESITDAQLEEVKRFAQYVKSRGTL